MARITRDRLLDALSYDEPTGVFTWRNPPNRHPQLRGQEAGRRHFGYVRIKLDGRLYQAHHLAWLYVTGEWPTMSIDHIDAVRSNNAFSNLRLATHSQNAANRCTPRTNTSGFKGVVWNKASGKWQAIVRFGGKSHYLGLFDDPFSAKSAYDTRQREIAGEFARPA